MNSGCLHITVELSLSGGEILHTLSITHRRIAGLTPRVILAQGKFGLYSVCVDSSALVALLRNSLRSHFYPLKQL